MTETKMTWADAWLLLSILHSKSDDGTFDLKSVIMIADAINHAILTHCEIDLGIERLILNGYLNEVDEKIIITDQSLKLFEDISRRKVSTFQKLNILEKKIGAEPYSASYKISNNCAGRYVTKSEYNKAISGYLGNR